MSNEKKARERALLDALISDEGGHVILHIDRKESV